MVPAYAAAKSETVPQAAAHVRSAIPAIEAYRVDRGTYVGLTLAKIRSYDKSVRGVTVRRAARYDAGIALETGGDSVQARISDVLIARNTIEGSVDIGINVAGGTLRGQHGTVEHVRVLDNRVHVVGHVLDYCCIRIERATIQSTKYAAGVGLGLGDGQPYK